MWQVDLSGVAANQVTFETRLVPLNMPCQRELQHYRYK